MQKINNKIVKILSVPIAAQITILPIMIKNFGTISFTFFISNIIAIPLLGISIIGGYLLTIFSIFWIGGAQQIGLIFTLILKVLMLIAKICGNLKLSNIYVITPNIITIIIYYLIVFFVICISQFRDNVVARKGCTFFSKTCREKMSNHDEMRRTYKVEL